MIATLVNAAAVIAGGIIGILFKKGIPERISDTVFKGLGLCTLFIGISGSLCGKNVIIVIISIVLGAIIGEGIDLDKRINSLGELIEKRFNKGGGKKVSIAEGFVTSSLLFCVGAMTIVGSLQSGLTGDHSTIFTKSTLDFVAAIIFASTLGIGVLFSAVFVLVYQGAITLFAQWLSPVLSTAVIDEMSCAGYILIIALALNMIGITKLKVMNYVPAVFLPIAICPLADLIGNIL
ncbi:MAG: DUF554 domain-containing protein [Acutalibacteraceae bacterium]